jgi:hypothetical protein
MIYSNPVITKLLKYCLEVYNNAYRFLNLMFSRRSPPLSKHVSNLECIFPIVRCNIYSELWLFLPSFRSEIFCGWWIWTLLFKEFHEKAKNHQIRRPRWPRNVPLPEQDVFRKQIVDGVLCKSGHTRSRPISLKHVDSADWCYCCAISLSFWKTDGPIIPELMSQTTQ